MATIEAAGFKLNADFLMPPYNESCPYVQKNDNRKLDDAFQKQSTSASHVPRSKEKFRRTGFRTTNEL